MRPRFAVALTASCFLAILGCGGDSSQPAPAGPNAPASPSPAASLIIDHTCTNTQRIPVEYIAQARASLRIAYGHTSHGSQLVSGMLAMRGAPGSLFDFSSSSGFRAGVFLNDAYPSGDLGATGDTSWRDRTVALLSRPDNDRNLVMWSWCGGVSNNTAAGIDAYLNAMSQLEQQYSNVRFVYMTGHLDGGGASGSLHQRNEQIRAFCRNGNKILFDFADIESYDPDARTDYMSLLANENCDYDSNGDGRRDRNWATSWVQSNPGHELSQTAQNCPSCAHSTALNCVLKGRAFWWMAARLAGWSGR